MQSKRNTQCVEHLLLRKINKAYQKNLIYRNLGTYTQIYTYIKLSTRTNAVNTTKRAAIGSLKILDVPVHSTQN